MSRLRRDLLIIEAAIGLVWNDGKLFIARRAPGGHLPGVWEFPGGKRKGTESFVDCIVRECDEELGGVVAVKEERQLLEYSYPDRHVRIHVFDCEWGGDEPLVNGGREWRWVDPAGLKRFKFPPANRPLIDKLVSAARVQRRKEKEASGDEHLWPPGLPNYLNELNTREWLLFQKSWFVHNPPPREKGVVVHPAKFPETLIEEFIRFFTKKGQTVLDPMLGTGSTLIAAFRSGRSGIGVELNEGYANIARQRLQSLGACVGSPDNPANQIVITGDSLRMQDFHLPQVDYCITSPPYWDMLRAQGSETQKRRREDSDLDVHYSDDPSDIGNLNDYDAFLDALATILEGVYDVLRPKGYLTVIVKNVKKKGKVYPLAWDIGKRLSNTYALKDEKIWCQDNQRLAPYGMGYAWVSNTFHHYCLNFRKEE